VSDNDVPDVRVPTPWARFARWRPVRVVRAIGAVVVRWAEPSRDYRLTRWLVTRLLGVVYVFAFLGLVYQALPLLGEHGLTPIGSYVDRMHTAGVTFWDVPSVFMWDASDTAILAWTYIGLAIAIAVLLGYANLPMLLVLWAIYGSFERVGQTWFSFGWEIQLLETTVIVAALAHPWDPRPLAARSPPVTALVLLRWLTFRIMLGAGLIKLRGSACWTDLTCLDGHFETQPSPNPLSAVFHHMPHAVHALGVVFNHAVELVGPFCLFGPRRVRLIAAAAMAAFQLTLIASGNLAFLNWLTLVPILGCFDDDALLAITPRRLRDVLRSRLHDRPARRGHRIWVACLAVVVAYKSVPVIENLCHHHQAMNRSYDRLELVNTYGAFGSVDMVRHELVIEGTLDADPTAATWHAYELPCKPGDMARRPCVLGPYHRRLDWLMWFASMPEPREQAWQAYPWVFHLVYKLLDGDRTVRELFAVDPFDGQPPAWIRIRRFVYHLEPLGADAWWTRDSEEEWLPPTDLRSDFLATVLAEFDWPSPSVYTP